MRSVRKLAWIGLALPFWVIAPRCSHQNPDDGVMIYFVLEEPGLVRLVITPNDRIPPWSDVTVRRLAYSVWVGGLASEDGSLSFGPFQASPGDEITLSAVRAGSEHYHACVIVGNFGAEAERCD